MHKHFFEQDSEKTPKIQVTLTRSGGNHATTNKNSTNGPGPNANQHHRCHSNLDYFKNQSCSQPHHLCCWTYSGVHKFDSAPGECISLWIDFFPTWQQSTQNTFKMNGTHCRHRWSKVATSSLEIIRMQPEHTVNCAWNAQWQTCHFSPSKWHHFVGKCQ